jgi:hypothetical protein
MDDRKQEKHSLMNRKKLWIFPVLMLMIAACTPAAPAPEPTAGPTRTPRPPFTAINACDVISERDLLLPMGEPMTIIDQSTPNESIGDYSFNSRCVYAGSDPASETLLTLQVFQPRPGLDIAPVDEIADRFITAMTDAGATRIDPVEEISSPAFWLPDAQTLTVFLEDGTSVSVSVMPISENARSSASQVVEMTLSQLGY